MKYELNKIYNGNSIEYMKNMVSDGLKVNTLLTDIPYDEVNRASAGLRTLDFGVADKKTFELSEFLELVDKVVTDNFIIFCGKGQISEIYKFFESKEYTTRLLVWEKTNPSVMNGQYVYLSGIETAVWARKPKGTFNASCKNTVFRYPITANTIHPTQKPLRLWCELIKDNTNEGDTILDTCSGSGVTAIACHKTNRDFICIELDKIHYENSLKWLNSVKSQISLFDNDYELWEQK